MAYLGDKSVGDVVKIKENGVAVNYIIVHKGKPSSLYDSSCDGVWLLRERTHTTMLFSALNVNIYEDSQIATWLNGTFLDTIDEKIRAKIKQVKIPYVKGGGDTAGSTQGVQSGANGLSCKVFLLSGYEVGYKKGTSGGTQYFPNDGTKLAYFSDGLSDSPPRVAYDNSGGLTVWWLRSPFADAHYVYCVAPAGGYVYKIANESTWWVRPAFVLPTSLLVDSDGNVSTNTLPTIASDKTGDLGTLTEGFTCNYSVNDADAADTLTVTLTLDGAQVDKFTATKEDEYTYSLTGTDWLKVTNGNHEFKISVTDGKDTVESTATFTRSVNKATVTLNTPLEADDVIRACFLKVDGSLPTDTDLLCEVTNNANDDEPVWEDCTIKVKSGLSYAFKNKVAENGFAFNFRISAARGASNAGGYISKISGGFE